MVGPIWLGLARDPFAQCCAPQKPDRQLGRDEDVPYGVRMSFHEWHNRLENLIGVPFRTHVCPPQVWLRGLSLWMTWPRPIFDTISLFVTYVYTNLILLLWTLIWTHETVPATVFRYLPDSRYPMKLNHGVSTNSVSHSKIEPLCKLIFCFHYVERHLHIDGKFSIFATFTFAPWKRKMYVVTHA